MPLLNLGGFEGRMFAPLAFAYIASVAASLLVALTVTPALCYYLLGRSRLIRETGDSKLVQWLKWIYVRILQWTLRRPVEIIGVSAILLVVALMLFPLMGSEFLPPFNEGALNINIRYRRERPCRNPIASAGLSRKPYTAHPKWFPQREGPAVPNSMNMPQALTPVKSKS